MKYNTNTREDSRDTCVDAGRQNTRKNIGFEMWQEDDKGRLSSSLVGSDLLLDLHIDGDSQSLAPSVKDNEEKG